MNADDRAEAATHHLRLAVLYAKDGSRDMAADHAEHASRLLQPLPGESGG